MKLRRIHETQFPTEKQLKDIIYNLKQKYPKDKFVFSSELSSNNDNIQYTLYRHYATGGATYPILNHDWPDFLKEYREFMKGE